MEPRPSLKCPLLGARRVVLTFLFGVCAAYGFPDTLYSATAPRGPQVHDLKAVKMSLQRTSCFGGCPAYSVVVQGNGTVLYEGAACITDKEPCTAQLDREEVIELLNAFLRVHFFDLRDEYDGTPIYTPWVGEDKFIIQTPRTTDLRSAILLLKIDDRTKAVRLRDGIPKELEELGQMMDEKTHILERLGLNGGQK